jgi:hypothetical protein
METFLPSCSCYFIWWKNHLSAAQAVFLTVWKTLNGPSNMKCVDPAFFVTAALCRKRGQLEHFKTVFRIIRWLPIRGSTVHRVLTWHGIGNKHHKMYRTKAAVVDSSLQLSIFAQTLGTASPFKLSSQSKTGSPAPFLKLIWARWQCRLVSIYSIASVVNKVAM